MRLALISLLLLVSVSVYGQRINPATDVRWPSCSSGQVYSPFSNICINNGGGGGGGVTSINTVPGAFTFTGAVNCTSTTCNFTGATAGVSSINSNTGAFTFNTSNWLTQSTNTFTVNTQRGNDAIVDWGFDNSGAVNTTNVTAMGNYLAALNANGSPGLKFPCGTYYFSSTVTISTPQKFIDFVGDNHASNGKTIGCVTFATDQNGPILWFDNTTSPLAGARIEHIQFSDTSASHNQVTAAIRITDQEMLKFNDVGGWNLQGQHYNSTTDHVAVTNGSTVVTGTGTNFDTNCGAVNTSSINDYPCFIVIKDTSTATSWPYEIANCSSTTVCTLAIGYNGATQASASYSIDSGGVLIWFDPGTVSSNADQYGYVFDSNNQAVWLPFYLASSTSGAIVNSRFNFIGGFANNNGITQDGIFAYCGHFCDTMNFNMVAGNGYPFGIVIADGHQNTVSNARFEQTAAPTVPTYGSCAAGGFPCSKGVVIMSDNASDTYGNQVGSSYFRQMGNGIEFSGTSGQTPTQSRVAMNTFRSNVANCVGFRSIATNSYGECDGDGQVNTFNAIGPAFVQQQLGTCTSTALCVIANSSQNIYFQSPTNGILFNGNLTLNGASKVQAPGGFFQNSSLGWTSASGVPGGACTTGSLYSNTSGGTGTTLYVCESSAWVAK